MSGIVGIINLDGAPVDRDLLHRMTDSMSFRGPDAQAIWTEGNAGFGHTMLRTTWEAETEKQPLTLDGKTWLVADARIDGRAELIAELEAKLGRRVRAGGDRNGSEPERLPNDAELILLAYKAWGEDCVAHLIGDFAFAIWSAQERRLFCARDHLGVRPFYYVAQNSRFLFSSSPHCLRLDPSISRDLNEQAIGDFLVFEMNLDPSTSAFKDIKRLSPAHQLQLDGKSLSIRRYWSLSNSDEIHYKRRSEYLDNFNELMRAAVRDRLRTGRVSLLLSGGMDSTTIGSFARRANKDGPNCELQAFTYVYDNLMADQERYYSGVAAKALGIPITHIASDDYKLFQWPSRIFHPSDPINEPLRAFFNDFVSLIAKHSRVALTGDSGDALLYADENYLPKSLRPFSIISLFQNAAYCLLSYGRIPRFGFRTAIRSALGISRREEYVPKYPEWLNPQFESRLSLRDRWKDKLTTDISKYPRRRRSFESLSHPMWPLLFEHYDPGTTGSTLEFRYPFFDKRVVNFLLNIPSVPWCSEKALLRIATREDLPPKITRRRKTAIVSDPILVRVEKPEWQLDDYFRPLNILSEYVNPKLVDKAAWLQNRQEIWMHVRPLSLNYWLKSL
jgi:asparagine synthase (glutamine-hydrolysing)